MYIITYSPNFVPPHFAARGIPKSPYTTQWKVTLLTFICCLFTPSGWSIFLFPYTQSTHFCTAWYFCKVWKRLGNAVPMGKLLFLPVRLRDVNVPISWRTKFRLKVSCLFPCAVEGGWFDGSYFTVHKTHIRTKCTINFHNFFEDRPTP